MTTGTYDGAPLRNDAPPSWEAASALSTARGIPWWAAVLVALAFTGIGVFVDLERIDKLGIIFQGCYFAGCLLAVLWVQRRGLFGPMVQPPLILALAVPGVVLAGSGAGAGDGFSAKALAVGTPLVNGFPTMAITTGVTVLIGLLRIAQQRPPRPPVVRTRTAAANPRGHPGPASRSNQPSPAGAAGPGRRSGADGQRGRAMSEPGKARQAGSPRQGGGGAARPADTPGQAGPSWQQGARQAGPERRPGPGRRRSGG